jgi:ADP-heptose:LPS heptosyltransferase
MRAIGFQQGLRGDLILSTVAARAFKQAHPEWHLTLGLNQQYADMAPLFAHSDFDDVHVYEGYDNWPTARDEAYLKRAGYDHVFDPMPKRANEATWWQTEHQAQNACSIYRLPYPSDGHQCRLTKWFDVPDYRDYVAFNYVGAFYAGYPNAKSYSPQRAREIVQLIRDKGHKVIVIGHPKEPTIEGTERGPSAYFDAVKTLLGCRAFVGIDSGFTWLASAYSHPTLACYSDAYYTKQYVGSIQPANPNARYLSAPNLNEVPLTDIDAALSQLL